MPDIAMCTGGTLPHCQDCYRRTAKPCMYQSYFGKPPEDDGECLYYWAPHSKRAQTETKPDVPRSK